MDEQRLFLLPVDVIVRAESRDAALAYVKEQLASTALEVQYDKPPLAVAWSIILAEPENEAVRCQVCGLSVKSEPERAYHGARTGHEFTP